MRARNITKLLAVAGFALGFATCASANITWTFDDATFCYDCGGAANNDIAAGSYFTTDNAADAVIDYDITVEGTNTQADNVYTPGDSFVDPVTFDATHLDFYDYENGDFLNLYLASPGITSSGGTSDLLAGDLGYTDNATVACPSCATLMSGSVTGSTVPEPKLGAFLLIGLAGLGFFARRKFANSRA
jgi:hypothetical protein